jgi:RNA polymerase sigma factor (sigma-70 family)
VEVMSMDRKLWTEARAIAARHEHGNRAEGEDLAQDLAVAALEEGATARNPVAWLERVGRNTAIDRWRVETRRAELASAIEPPAGPIDPETALLGRERRGLVRRALAALPRPQRRAALARFHADLPYDAVAARVGAPPVTARTRVHRALASLRTRLGALRAMFFVPGVQLSALGVLFVAHGSPALAPSRSVAVQKIAFTAPRGGHHFARTRLIAELPVLATAKRPTPKIVTSPPPAPDEPPPPQRMVFGEELVEGSVLGPDGEIIRMMPPVVEPSLIEIRRHFVPEMLKSLEDL